MSRIGKKLIKIPAGVKVDMAGSLVTVTGPKGSLKHDVHPTMSLKKADDALEVVPVSKEVGETKKFWGLTRTLVDNLVTGVTTGFSKKLTLQGVGYRAAVKGKTLVLTLGYSHPIDFAIPEGIEIKVDKQTSIEVSGADKCLVGQTSATIRG